MSSARPFPPSNHPSVEGREPELAALADAVRRLTLLTITNTAPPATTADVAAELHAICDRLDAHVPDPVPPRHVPGPPRPLTDLQDGMPFDPVTGRWHPFALPVEFDPSPDDPTRAVARTRFTVAYEGPPGCVHGAVLAGVFDMALTAANRLADAAGPTMQLSLKFRKPTRLAVDTVFEAWVAKRTGRVTTAVGTASQDGQVTVEAEGTFLHLPYERVQQMGADATR